MKVAGERGKWKFISYRPEQKEVTVYGGDSDPNGRRAHRTFMEDRIKVLPKPAEERPEVAIGKPPKRRAIR